MRDTGTTRYGDFPLVGLPVSGHYSCELKVDVGLLSPTTHPPGSATTMYTVTRAYRPASKRTSSYTTKLHRGHSPSVRSSRRPGPVVTIHPMAYLMGQSGAR